MEITRHRREIVKLFLNSLYGRSGQNDNSTFEFAVITSYARNIVTRAVQENYEDFVYADTDSVHLK